MCCNGLAHRVAPLPVRLADAPNLAGKPTPADELVSDGLPQGTSVEISALFGHHESLADLRRTHSPGHAEPRGQRLGKRAQVDHVAPHISSSLGVLRKASGVQRDQRRNGLTLKPKHTIGVVLQDGHPHPVGDAHDLLPALQAHGDPRGILEIGYEIHELGMRRIQELLELIHIEAILADGHAGELDAIGLERLQGAKEGGVFHQDRVSFLQKDPPHEVQGLLRPAGDDDVLHLGRYTQLAHVFGQCLAQRGKAAGEAILQRLAGSVDENMVADLIQLLDGKEVCFWPAAGHGDHIWRLGDLEYLPYYRRGHPLHAPGTSRVPVSAHGSVSPGRCSRCR